MKSVLISIQPKWCELIASGKKTIEVRKTAPKLQPPFKCYIYCTKEKYRHLYDLRKVSNGEIILNVVHHNKTSYVAGGYLNGKIIGEFVCDRVERIDYQKRYIDDLTSFSAMKIFSEKLNAACLNLEKLNAYGNGAKLYGWHISDLKIYDKPKELSEFNYCCPKQFTKSYNCSKGFEHCKYFVPDVVPFECDSEVKKPPQSWCYVEV